MSAFTFKTNIHCGGCVRSVTGFINEVPQLQSWSVDTEHPDKLLSVEGEHLQATAVQKAVEEAGFTIELVTN